MSTVIYPATENPPPSLAERHAHRNGVVIIMLAFLVMIGVIVGFVVVTVQDRVHETRRATCVSYDPQDFAVRDVPTFVYPSTTHPQVVYAYEHLGSRGWMPVDDHLDAVAGADTVLSPDTGLPHGTHTPDCAGIR